MQTIRHINPLGYVDMPYLRDEHGNPRQGPAVVTRGAVGDHRHGTETEPGTGCLTPGEELEVSDEDAAVLLAQVVNFELVSLGNLTVPELEGYAESRGIDLGEAKRKGDVVKVIVDEQAERWEARQQPAVDEDLDAEEGVDAELVDPETDPDAAGDAGTDQQEG